MPTKILVSTADGDDVEHWVEDEVVRLGSDPQSDIQLVGHRAAPHTATLEFLDGVYRIYNRSSTLFEVGDQVVPPGGSVRWKDGHRLETSDGTVLTLKIEGDPTPSRRPTPSEVEDDWNRFEPVASPESGAAAPVRPSSAQGMIQGLVALICGMLAVVLAISILVPDLDPFAFATTKPTRAPGFSAVIRRLSEAEAQGEPELSTIRTALQSARIAEVRGDRTTAHLIYDRVRDVLVGRGKIQDCDLSPPTSEGEPDQPMPIDCQVWAYVRAHR